LHDEIEVIDREEFLPHNLQQLSNDLQGDVFSHKHELEMDNEEAEGSPTIIISDFYKSEDLVSLDTKHNDQLSFGQMPMEISKGSPQFSDLQTKGNCSNHEELDLQRSSIFKVEQQEDCKYESNLTQHLTICSDLAMNQDIDHIGVHILNHFEQEVEDDFLSNSIIKSDHNQNSLNSVMQSSYESFW
jgi:hypothetical protein